MKISKSFSLEDSLLKWIEQKSESKKMSISEFATYCFEKERKEGQVNIKSSLALEEESKLAFQKSQDLKYMAINRKLEEEENARDAQKEAERIIEIEKKSRIKTREELSSEANDWVAKLSPEAQEKFRNELRKNRSTVTDTWMYALQVGFPERDFPVERSE